MRKPTRRDFIDMEGFVVGQLTVKSYFGKVGRNSIWICECSCGAITKVMGHHLRSKKTKSCGCFRIKRARALTYKHGQSKTPEYITFHAMIRRCNATSGRDWNAYKDISICERWKDFDKFMEDMRKRPSQKHTIERIDNSKGYSPENCRWATRTEQNRNKRCNRVITFQGRSQCLSAWAEEYKLNYKLLWSRLKYGWSFEKAITTPIPSSSQKKQLSLQL